MRKCLICGKINGSGPYFCVPQDERRRQQWTEMCCIELNPKGRICSDHFLSSDMIVGAKRVQLMPNAVPSIGIVAQIATHSKTPMAIEHSTDNNELTLPADGDALTYTSDEHELHSPTENRCNSYEFVTPCTVPSTGVDSEIATHSQSPMTIEPPIDNNDLKHPVDDDGLTCASDEHGLHSQTDIDSEKRPFELKRVGKISSKKCCLCTTEEHTENLFKPPKGMELLWSKKCGLTIRKNSRVCGKHFDPNDFRKNTKHRIIRNYAVPFRYLPQISLTNAPEMVAMNFINEELYDETAHHTNDDSSSTTVSCSENSSCQEVHKDVRDEEPYNYKSIAVQTDASTTRTCGFIQITMKGRLYTLQCMYCAEEFPLWSWTKFVTHMKDNHQAGNQANVNTDELYNDNTYIDKENYIFVIKSKDERRIKTSNILQDSTTIVNSSSKAIQFDERVSRPPQFENDEEASRPPEFDVVVPPSAYKEDVLNIYGDNTSGDDDNDGSTSEDDDASFKKKQPETCQHSDICSTDEEDFNLGPRESDLIRFGWTDRNIIVDFLELLKTHPVLCYKRQEPFEEYDAALEAVTKILNKKWDCGLTGIGVRISLNRIIDWYRQVLIKMDKFKEEYKCKYPEYFKKCEDVLPKQTAVKCALCDNSFLNGVDLQVHQIMIHGKSKFPHKCSECDWLFADANTLQQHQKNHEEKEQIERFYCSMCNKGFNSQHLLKIHITMHQECEICGKRFWNPVKYQRHRLLHDPPKFKCRLCPKIYHWQERLTEHMKLHRNQRDYICEECGRSFIRRATLNNHKYMLHRGGKATERLKVHYCKICEVRFKSSAELHVHRVKRHLVLEGTIEELTTYRRKRRTNSFTNNYKWIVDPENPTKKRIVCKICGNSYAHHSGFYVHGVKVHNFKPVNKRRVMHTANKKPAKTIEENNENNMVHIDENIINTINDDIIEYKAIEKVSDENDMDHFDDNIIEEMDDDIIEYIEDELIEFLQ